ncbi:hypothetical protein [Candidatus Clostridium helianthi]|uniref:Uncharacterized protein n=1 Tax=Candidatus Clostridium helianthi TaxID=3381660 RepID=A0ABW8S5T3_9CLOT
MKKSIFIFSIFLFLSFNINTTTILAQVDQPKTFKEGFYSIRDLGLLENVSYTVQNTSEYRGFIVVFDSEQKIQQAISLDPHSQKFPLKPISNADRVVILGQGMLTFSSLR